MVLRDLRVYSLEAGGRLSYYRDRYGLEADAVLHLQDGRYAMIEIKLGSDEIEKGAEHLRLVSAICVEISDEWETNNYRYMSTIKEL